MSFFPFLLNKCNILLLENKTFSLSSKETRLKNNDKILSQFTNRFRYVPTVLKNNRQNWEDIQSGGLLREERCPPAKDAVTP